MRWLVMFCIVVLAGQTQQPVFRTATDHITTQVSARDKAGRFVPDLKLSEFEVDEDGVRQQVTSFGPIVGGRAVGATTTVTSSNSRGEGLILPAPRTAPDTSGRIFIVFIDDMHLQALDSPRVKNVLAQIRDEVLRDTDLVGIVSSGYSSIAQDLTYDYGHKRFNEALKKVMGSADTPQQLVQSPQTAQGPVGVRYRAHVAFSLAHDLLLKAEKISDRRKSFIYVSNGYDFNPFRDSRYRYQQEQYGIPEKTDSGISTTSGGGGAREPIVDNPFDRGGNQFSEADLIGEVAELIRAARRANVVFYTIDPRGLDAGPSIDAPITNQEWHEHVTISQSSLRVLGDETGGFCICNSNEFRKRLQQIDNETSDYYIVGYTSNNPDPMKMRRTIEIKVTRPGVELIYKSEYMLPRVRK